MSNAQQWATEEFGDAELGDARRRARLVLLAAETAKRPSGRITTTCSSSATREGAFRLLENSSVRRDAIAESVHSATVRRCKGHEVVFVPVDGTSLRITDNKFAKGLGPIGSWDSSLRGAHV